MASLQQHLEAQQCALPPATRAQAWRGEAFTSFNAFGLPTRRDERWRYTDLKPLDDDRFSFVPAPPDAETRARVAALLETQDIELDGPRLVFIDGHFDARFSRAAVPPGVAISSLADAWDSFVPQASSNAAEKRPLHPLAALNTAFVQQGALLKLARDVVASAPLHCVFVTAGRDKAAVQPRIVIELAEGAAATVVQHFMDALDAAPSWLNLVTEVTQGAGSNLTVYRLQEHGTEQVHTSLLRARLARDARLTAGYVDRGGKLVRNDIDVALAEPGAQADLFGILLASGAQHIDNSLRVDHAAPRTTSIESFRSIVDDRAHGVFCGKVTVRPGAQHIDARQSSDNLLLSAKAEIDTKPELEIYADDVKCTHGATVGELDEEHMFYLRSRGLSADAARALLTFAFAHVTLERIALPALRKRAIREIAGRLPEGVEWESP
jgi:Fe-S cluster assembly protein SufD